MSTSSLMRTIRGFDNYRPPLFGLALLLQSGCSVDRLGFLNPAGPIASSERHLFLIVVVVMLFVVGPVIILTPLFAWHYRLSNTHNAFRPKWSFSWILEFFIWIPPTAIVAGLSVLLWRASQDLDPYSRIMPSQPPFEIQAVAYDWKWLFIYPETAVATLNELDIPAGRPIHISITSATVMQSLFIPRLAGQIYAMPAMVTQLNMAADAPGTFAGANAQYSGAGFPRESFSVVARGSRDYAAWRQRFRANSVPFDASTLESLRTRKTEPHVRFFSSIPAGLFEHIVAATGSGPGPSKIVPSVP